MTDTQLAITTLANGATAQLRSIIDGADRETARRIYAELNRLSAIMARKHGFDRQKKLMRVGLER